MKIFDAINAKVDLKYYCFDAKNLEYATPTKYTTDLIYCEFMKLTNELSKHQIHYLTDKQKNIMILPSNSKLTYWKYRFKRYYKNYKLRSIH